MLPFVRPEDASVSRSLRQDMDDIYEMRTSGLACTLFEMRWSFIHVDELVMDASAEAGPPTVTMSRVTDHYCKRFARDINMWMEMFQFAICSTRNEKVYTKDDPERKRKYGEAFSVYAKAEVPFVVPYKAVEFQIKTDDKFRDIIVPVDDRGRPRKDVFVVYGRRGGISAKTQRVVSECGSLLEDWRRYTSQIKLYGTIMAENAKPVPYVEFMTKNEQVRLDESAQQMERVTLYAPEIDACGNELTPATVLKKIEPTDEHRAKSFIEVPENRKLSSVQPMGKSIMDIDATHKRWMGHLALALQIPARYIQTEENKGLGAAGNDATVEDDMLRAARGASERRDEIVDALVEAHERIYSSRPGKVHLPIATHMKPPMLFHLFERGMMDGKIMVEEMAHAIGIKSHRLTEPIRETEEEKKEKKSAITLEDVVRALGGDKKKKKKKKKKAAAAS